LIEEAMVLSLRKKQLDEKVIKHIIGLSNEIYVMMC